ncbi:MAG: 30S ribosomal protein S4 [Bdellovibrionaceae bacterium]|nr:30S ribosomal protein S4 [Pseudobdellovibrionaceae bacterium]
MKRTGKTPRFKRQRRLMVELPGMGKAGALERKPYPPGEHGQKRKKFSEFGLQLEEKQKVLYHYGLRESQLRRMIGVAKRKADINWVDTMINLLEKRIDNVVFRLGFASSIPAAKQIVNHGKVLVNGKKVTIRSAVLKKGDSITLTTAGYKGQTYLMAKEAPRLPLPDYLRKEMHNDVEVGIIADEPGPGDFPVPFDQGLFTSFYNLRGG